MRAPKALVVCCALMSCAKLVGIHDYDGSDAGVRLMGDGGGDGGGSNPVPDCSLGLSQGGVCPRSLAVGVDDTCAIAPDGLYCWGQDVPGMSADAYVPKSVTTTTAPTLVASSTSLDGFASSFGTTCFLDGHANLTCWGNTEVGQALLQEQRMVLTEEVLSLAFTPIDAVAVGGDHVVVSGGGSGVCWGATSDHQCNTGPLGMADCDGFATSCEITNTLGLGIELGTLTLAGRAHSCTSPDGSDGITCWGDDSLGQLGTENAVAIGQVQLAGGSVLDVASGLALGANHSCAIVGSGADSETYCWGANDQGQLGIDSSLQMSMTATPVMLSPGIHFAAIAAGSDTTCAIDTATNVWCWGADTQGAAGQGPVTGAFLSLMKPTMTTVTDAMAIGVGYEHACALLETGAIECWGDNSHGELGDGVTQHMNSPCGLDDCSWQPVTVKGH